MVLETAADNRATSFASLLEGVLVRMSFAVAICIALIALFLSGYYYVGLKKSGERFKYAVSDNVTWTVAQAEVDYRNLQLELRRSLMEARDPAQVEVGAVRLAFDIYYSRIDAGVSVSQATLGLSVEPLAAVVSELLNQKEGLAKRIDSWPLQPSSAQVRQFLSEVDGQEGTVRTYAVAMLELLVDTANKERLQHVSLLQQSAQQIILVIILLLAMLIVALLLQWKLKRRVRQTERLAFQMERVIEVSQDAVIITDAAGVVKEFNSAACRMFGYSVEQALGANALELVLAPDDVARGELWLKSRSDVASELEAGDIRRVERLRDAFGRDFPAEITIAISHDGLGAPIWVAILRDISERVAKSKSLRAAIAAAEHDAAVKQQFLTLMSHEMRTPLQGVLATFDLLELDDVSASQKKLLALGRKSGEKALSQINNSLELARLGHSETLREDMTIEPVRVLYDLIDLLEPLLIKHGNTIEADLAWPSNMRIQASPVLFEVIFENLLANANKFTKNGTISVSLDAREGEQGRVSLRVAVGDTGRGIVEAQMPRIFDDFETEGGTARDGTGLGLGLAKRAAESMGGRLVCDSQLGVGSTFTFECEFSIVTAVEGVAPERPKTVNGQGGVKYKRALDRPRVLVVDDINTNRVVICAMLERLECDCDCAENGADAVQKCLESQYDLILMDLRMPVLDGYGAAQRIVEQPGEQGPIICMTAHNADGDFERLRKAGFVEHALKPLRLTDLDGLVQRHVFATLVGSGESVEADVSGDTQTLDVNILYDLLDVLGASATREACERFADRCELDLRMLSEQGEGPSVLQAELQLHELLGSAGMMGAAGLAAQLKLIEMAPDARMSGGIPVCLDLLGAYRVEVREFVAALDPARTVSSPSSLGNRS